MRLCAFYVPAGPFDMKCCGFETQLVLQTDITAFSLFYNWKMPFLLYMKLHRQAVTTLAELITYLILSKHFLVIKPLRWIWFFFESGWDKLRSSFIMIY